MMTLTKSTTEIPLDEIDRLRIILKKYLPTIKSEKLSMIALHLSDISDEIPRFQKNYTALVQREELSEDDFIDCIAELEVSVFHMLGHIKDLHKRLKKAVDALP
ncbi:hypothetical protein HYR99_23055 [Candidatus Poribacteria bacterium]|nr:hypothetical protein [Candidatus Poribacteria bacterium]